VSRLTATAPSARRIRNQAAQGQFVPKPGWIPGALAVLSLLAFFAYLPALKGPFIFDDDFLLFARADSAELPSSYYLHGVRPLLMLTYLWNVHTSGHNPLAYHLVNLALHLANGALIFVVVRKLLAVSQAVRVPEYWALFAAGLFLLSPLQTESVSYIAGRSETLSVFFALSAYAIFLRRFREGLCWSVSALIVALYGAACLSKEHIAVFPALLLLTDFFWNPGFSFEGIRRNWRLYIPIAGLGCVAGASIGYLLMTADTVGFHLRDLSWRDYLFTQFRVIWGYFRLFVLPAGQNLDYDTRISRSILEPGVLLGLAALLGLSSWAWRERRRHGLIAFGFFCVLVLLAPTSSVVPIRDPFVERRLYLPFIGLLLASIGLLKLLRWNWQRYAVAAMLVLLVNGVLCYRRNKLWADPVALWSDTAAKSPHKQRPAFQLGVALFNQGRCADSVKEFERGARLGTLIGSELIDWAVAYGCVGRSAEAIDKLKQAVATQVYPAHAYAFLAAEYARLGRTPDAMAAAQQAVQMDGTLDLAYQVRAAVFAMLGDLRAAAQDYQRALALNPHNDLAQKGWIAVEQALSKQSALSGGVNSKLSRPF
jgi:hypothetical protein